MVDAVTVFEVEMLLDAWKRGGFDKSGQISREQFLKLMKEVVQ